MLDVINSFPNPISRNVALSFTEGRVVRDLLCGGLLDRLREQGLGVVLFTPAARVADFVKEWEQPGIQFKVLRPFQLSNQEYRALKLRQRFQKLGRVPLQLWLGLERSIFSVDFQYVDLLRQTNCRAVVITNPLDHAEMPLYLAAKKIGVPSLGVIRSWDNLYRGLRIRTETLAVWNRINHDEATSLMKYSGGQIAVIGGTQFDTYFAPDTLWSREQFAARFQLDPERPIVTLATLGAFLHLYDETYLMDILLEAIQQGRIAGKPQLVCRLHPASKLEHFKKYEGLPDVRISSICGYIPTIGWTMSRQDVALVANLLRHSDVIVSPGSTITLEAAIFDTPTVVPVFHMYQPELGQLQYQHHLTKHFRRLAELDLIPIISNPNDLIESINHALEDPTWYRAERVQLVQDYIQFTDGRSTERLANLIGQLVGDGRKIV